MQRQNLPTEENLDPADWEQARALAHQMMDDAIDYLRDVAQNPVWSKTPDTTKQLTTQPLPRLGTPVEDIYADFKTHILPYNKGNVHPRFFSWVQGNGTLTGALGDMLASVMNPNVAIGDHAAMYVDAQVIEWSKEMFGFPPTASGILLSGGSVANITAIAVARNAFSEQVRGQGLYAFEGRMLIYCSTETHACIQKAAEMIGIGSEQLRRIGVDAQYRMDITDLERQIAQDKAEGFLPFCIVGTAGTVNTGAIDPLDDILSICRREQLWFHIDGAFGALAKLAPEFSTALQAIEQADSLAFDFHKWLYINYEVGCTLIRDGQKHRAAFALQPSYLLSHERGLPAGPDPITNYGMELSRGFKALKIWMSLREHGIEKYARLVAQNIEQARYLGQLVTENDDVELLVPVSMNIVCLRFRPKNINDDEVLNALNKEILMQLHEHGIAAPSFTILRGKYVIRVCIVNHRTTNADLVATLQGILDIGNTLLTNIITPNTAR